MQTLIRLYRPNLAFLLGLCAAAALAFFIERQTAEFSYDPQSQRGFESLPPPLPLAQQFPLTEADMQAARTAWAYVAANTQWDTGFVNAVDGYPSATLWDLGSYIFALVSANRLGLVEDSEFDRRARLLLSSLETMPLFEGLLPNKAYDTRSLAMVDYTNAATEGGVGWSAIDLGRVVAALKALRLHAPRLTPEIDAATQRWAFDALVENGTLVGAARDPDTGASLRLQEGRLGYEQYAARALMTAGLGASRAASAAGVVRWTEVEGIPVPADRRSHHRFDAITTTLSEPFVLMGLEMGWDDDAWREASQIFRAMQSRHLRTGTLTMLSEDHVDEAPFFLYGAVLGNGEPWVALAEDGSRHDALRSVSLKAAFGWEALLGAPYAEQVKSEVMAKTATPSGWLAGIYESDSRPNTALTLNTNAVILEALHYKMFGPLVPPGRI
ncbi:hypothetical protein PSA7680_03269 [Pseudoruegeria aquimaris]|uniref:DUF3131 domain-containing protein n=1 Tax=Pseudoruegeria aquimaris TaxID=393663 RepID=A0A1Y5TEE5_9RHOB|nr:DUF3131 domain-containing protein [Pseudoruegeria aquimaris]SLN61940.1 hypothetical protein PSA7680_03269 [Pseudoruegeria aquimaris]